MPEGQLFKLLTRRGWNSEFTLKVALSRNFLLRIQSGRLPLYRQRVGGHLFSAERLDKQVDVGLVNRKLVIKLRKRERVTGVSEIAREFIRKGFGQNSLELRIPPLLYPVRYRTRRSPLSCMEREEGFIRATEFCRNQGMLRACWLRDPLISERCSSGDYTSWGILRPAPSSGTLALCGISFIFEYGPRRVPGDGARRF